MSTEKLINIKVLALSAGVPGEKDGLAPVSTVTTFLSEKTTYIRVEV